MRKLCVALLLTLLLPLAACGGGETLDEAQQRIADGAVVVDVRTPAEYAEGHLDGAVNIDFNAPDFQAKISELPTDGSYVLYCRSGNRSGQAMAVMEQLGFTDVFNAGAYDDLR